MAIYPIRMLRDEDGNVFIPATYTDSVIASNGNKLQVELNKKIEVSNIIQGDNIELTKSDNNVIIKAVQRPLVNNLNTAISGTGALDAYQGRVLSLRTVPAGGTTNQVLKKRSDDDYSLEWSDADPNIIESISVNGVDQTVVDKNVDLTIPTKVSELTNDSSYISGITSTDVTTALGYTPYDATNPDGYTTNIGTITGISVNGTSIATSGVANITNLPAEILSGNIQDGVTAITQSASDNSTKLATTAYVDRAIDNLPQAMIFKGSLGIEGTITELPSPSKANAGFAYVVITKGTYAGKAANVGDMFVSDATEWVLIPVGDDTSGTVTSIAIKTTGPISIDDDSAITTSGERTISHATSGVTEGTYTSVTVNATGHITAGSNPTTLAGYGITDALDSTTKYASSSTVGGVAIEAAKVSNALTIQKNGTDIDTFDGSATKSINITVPTKTSDITNDSNFITASDDITGNANTATRATYASGTSTTGQLRNITISTAAPSGGSNGDIWIVYTS